MWTYTYIYTHQHTYTKSHPEEINWMRQWEREWVGRWVSGYLCNVSSPYNIQYYPKENTKKANSKPRTHNGYNHQWKLCMLAHLLHRIISTSIAQGHQKNSIPFAPLCQWFLKLFALYSWSSNSLLNQFAFFTTTSFLFNVINLWSNS